MTYNEIQSIIKRHNGPVCVCINIGKKMKVSTGYLTETIARVRNTKSIHYTKGFYLRTNMMNKGTRDYILLPRHIIGIFAL